jgi:hypothetical protein
MNSIWRIRRPALSGTLAILLLPQLVCSIFLSLPLPYSFDLTLPRYHAQSETHRADGLYGGLVVHLSAPTISQNNQSDLVMYDYQEEVLLLVGDWYHEPAKNMLAKYMDPKSNTDEVCNATLSRSSYLVQGRNIINSQLLLTSRTYAASTKLASHQWPRKVRLHQILVWICGQM